MIPCTTKVWRPSAAAERIYDQHKIGLDEFARKTENRDSTPYECFLNLFGSLPMKHPQKHEFLLLCWQQQWPEMLQIESGPYLNHWIIRMAKGFCFSKRLNLMGCGSSGKTAAASAYAYTMWKAHPFNSSVFLSTTSAEAGESRTWGQVKDFHKNDRLKVGNRIETLHIITLDEELRDEEGKKEREYRNGIKCINIKPGNEGKSVMASIVGRKNAYVIWICDEFPHMDIGILNARVNLNTNTRGMNQFIGLGNAPEEGDPMYIDAAPYGPKYPDGWRSANKDLDQSWPTEKGGLVLYFNGSKSPNFQCSKNSIPFPGLMNHIAQHDIMQDAGGEETPMYWKQFYGFPPTVDISDKVLTHKLLETNGAFAEPLWMDVQQKILAGLDLGFRADGDPSVIHFGRIGKSPQNRTHLCVEPDGIPLTPKQGNKEAFEPQIAKQVVDQCQKRGCHDLAADVTGDGGLLVQAIEREARERGYQLNVLAVSFSGSPEDRVIIPGEKRTAKQMFDRMVAQLWVSLRVSVLNKVVFGMTPRSKSVEQLCARRMGTDEKKRQTVEKKSEMKKRLRRSPDFADATVLLHHLALRHGLSGLEIANPKEPFDPLKFVRKQAGPQRYQAQHRSIYSGR